MVSNSNKNVNDYYEKIKLLFEFTFHNKDMYQRYLHQGVLVRTRQILQEDIM